MLTIEQVKKKGWLIYECIVGSRAYGLDSVKSDTDIRGVYILPKELFYSLEYTGQVSNESNDIVYYELRRFVELLSKNNPNILELLSLPEKFILQKHTVMNKLTSAMFLSKLCHRSFANYAYTQIKKASGLEKKIVRPMDKERKSILAFCFVHSGRDVHTLLEFLANNGMKHENMGLTAIPHMRDCYNLYHSAKLSYAGIIKKEAANDVALSSVPMEELPVGVLYFNKDGYSVYCREHNEYWGWVAKRNEDRYRTTMDHGKKYDSKNMMHVFRLLRMAKEIAVEGKINVSRKDRQFLLDIKHGKFEYDELVAQAQELKAGLNELYEKSDLMEAPDMNEVNRVLIEMREEYYKM